ncbi:hypothetical protein RUM43_010637 [Polyplax serrata]|uniref:Serpin domain-containing protein n=1 Tax=Polyplax serrata TaxID=468196 RepID=A0AAN8S7C3_POLSC
MKPVVHFYILWAVATTAVVAFRNLRNEHSTPESVKVSKAACNFTLNLLKILDSKSQSANIAFSPASINILLSVLQQGARANTAVELENVLGLSREESKRGYGPFLKLKKEKNVTLEWGNRCYIKPGMQLNENFKGVAKRNFDVDVEEMEFGVPSPQSSAQTINSWIKDITHNQIKNLVDPSSISVETIMLMVNAIFFKGVWAKPFRKKKTTVDKFEITSRDSVQTYFMAQREKYYSGRDTDLGAKWVQQPFQNGRFAMFYVMPIKRHRLTQLLSKMSGEDLHKIFNHFGVNHVKLRIPKFKVSDKVSLVDTLKKVPNHQTIVSLGLRDIFTSASDLGGIASSTSLAVSDVVHQANVEIDEKGGSGSAATVVQFLRMRTPTMTFVADQPFLFFIVDKKTKIPLFAGKLANPQPYSLS